MVVSITRPAQAPYLLKLLLMGSNFTFKVKHTVEEVVTKSDSKSDSNFRFQFQVPISDSK